VTLPSSEYERVRFGSGSGFGATFSGRRAVARRNRLLLIGSVLLLLSVHLLSTGVRQGDLSSRPRRILMDVMFPLDAAMARVARTAEHIYRSYFDLVGVNEQNQQLKARLAQLDLLQARLTEVEADNRRLSELLEVRRALSMKAVAANVIGGDATGMSRSIVVDRGERSGVKPGLAVLSEQGVVGKVIAASRHSARVLLLEDHNCAADVLDQRSRIHAIVAGAVDDGVVLKYVQRSEDVKPGDRLVTSGLDGVFPRGLLVGTISQVRPQSSGLFLDVRVAPAVNFRQLEQVLVLTEEPPRSIDHN
jgi:rod shape-determining protein MreC